MRYVAAYEDRARTCAAAMKAGWDGNENGPNDYVDPADYRSSRTFISEQLAVQWLTVEITQERTYWGCGDILVFQDVPPLYRCDACTCFGKKLIRRYVIDDGGKADEENIDDCCFDSE